MGPARLDLPPGDGFFPLLAREFAPLADRLTSAAGRLETLPDVLEAAEATLVGHAGRPVGRFQTETALRAARRDRRAHRRALAAAEPARATDPVVARSCRASSGRGRRPGRRSPAFATHLRDVVLPASDGEGRLGPELFAAKMRHTMRSDDLTPTGSWPAPSANTTRSAPRWSGSRASCGRPGARTEPRPTTRRRSSAASSTPSPREHPAADDLLDFCRAENARIEAFCRERDLIGLADEPLEIRWTPVFLRAFGGAMLVVAGPARQGPEGVLRDHPDARRLADEQRESNLREDNDRMLRLLTIHEAVPGHYLQGVYANRCPSIVRAIFASGALRRGLGRLRDPGDDGRRVRRRRPGTHARPLEVLPARLTNAIIDARIHTAGMTEDEAVSLMVDGGFQEHAEARAKYDRARLSSTQLSTYFTGSLEMWDIEREVRRRAAAASGDPLARRRSPNPASSAASARRPGFDYRDHLESVISHGSPPTSLLRRIILA